MTDRMILTEPQLREAAMRGYTGGKIDAEQVYKLERSRILLAMERAESLLDVNKLVGVRSGARYYEGRIAGLTTALENLDALEALDREIQ